MATNYCLQMHSTYHGGHSGIDNTFFKISQLYFWSTMREDIKVFVNECDVCQHNRKNYPASGIVEPLVLHKHVWCGVSIDFIEGFPKSNGKTTIMVVVDHLSKYAHFISLSHPFTVVEVANAYFDNVGKLHGLPQDLGTNFLLVFFGKSFFSDGHEATHDYYISSTIRRTNTTSQSLFGDIYAVCCWRKANNLEQMASHDRIVL